MIKNIQSWRVQNQILVYFLLVFILLLGIIVLLIFIHQIILMDIIQNYTKQVVMKQNANTIHQEFSWQSKQFEYILNLNLNALDKIKRQYNYIIENPELILQSPQQCPSIQPLGFKESNICYNVAGLPERQPLNSNQVQILDLYLRLTSLLQMMLPLSDQQQFIVGNWSLGYADEEYFAAYQAIGYYSDFKLSTRPFYKNHKQHKEEKEYIFTDVFKNFEGFYKLIITSNLTSQANDVVATQFEFSNLQRFFSKNFMILTADGLLLMGDIFSKSLSLNISTVYLYNETLTGFNNEDWINIKSAMKNNQYDSNCSTKQSYLCRHNSLTNRDIILLGEQFTNPDFILIMQQEVKQDVALINRIDQIQTDVIDLTQFYLTLLIIEASILFTISIFAIRYYLKPIRQIIELSIGEICHQTINTKQKQIMISLLDNNNISIIGQLKTGFLKLLMQNHRHSKECQLIQQFKYPRKTISSPDLFNDYHQLENNNDYLL